jgi:hypothetical protein
MLAGMLLHQGKTPLPVQYTLHFAAGFQGAVAQMHHGIFPLLHIQNPDSPQRTQVAGLAAAFGIESSGIQNHFPAFVGGAAGEHPGRKPGKVAVFII